MAVVYLSAMVLEGGLQITIVLLSCLVQSIARRIKDILKSK
ncbi:hypothetical protein [Desulfosporosinus sp. BG]|nr:hypothetical protein [Desulfosporosinus sp. BG]ODA40310.1 hypothetical protein DSBG_2909 [Desulfosporosinus sp. BG]